MRFETLVCWEATDIADPMTRAAGRLYEQTLAPDERIPWAWIERSIGNRGKSGERVRHLILAAPEGRTNDPAGLAGYAYGMLIPGYGGYLCYLGVADWARRLGVGTKLYEEFYRLLQADAARLGVPLSFVIWESHRPEPGAPAADHELWNARVRLFERVGGLWLEGVEFLSPNFAEGDDADPVPLQLFLKPMDCPATAFTPERLRQVVAGLHEQIYRNEPGDPLYDGTLTSSCHPRLIPATQAGSTRAEPQVLV